LKDPIVHFGKEYKIKIDDPTLSNYHRLCLADTKREFVKSIEEMLCRNFMVKEVSMIVRVSYTKTMFLHILYDAKNNEVIIVDIL